MGRGLVCIVALLATPALADASMRIESVDVVSHKGRADVMIRTTGAPVFQTFAKKNPALLIVDVFDAAGQAGPIAFDDAPFSRASASLDRAPDGRPIVRYTFALSRPVKYDVSAERETVRISLWDDELRHEPKVAALDRPERTASDAGRIRLAQGEGDDEEGSAGASTDDGSTGNGKFKMTYIGFKNTSDGSRIFARMNEPGAKFTAKKEGENLLVIEIQDAYIPLRNNKNHLDTTFFESPVKMITPGEVEGTPTTIRIVVEMKEDVPFEQKEEGKEIVIFTKK